MPRALRTAPPLVSLGMYARARHLQLDLLCSVRFYTAADRDHVMLSPWCKLNKESLRWVPKNSVDAREVTPVPEAAEISQEKSFDYGEKKAFSSTSVAGLSPEGE